MLRRISTYIPRIMLLGLSLLFALGLAECLARVFHLAPDIKPIEAGALDTAYQRSANPILGFELRPGYTNANADGSITFSRINTHGQRDVEHTTAKPPGTLRVAVIGDSVVEGYGIRDLNDLIARQLEPLLAEDNAEVLNFGVSGYNFRAYAEVLRTRALAFEPDVDDALRILQEIQQQNSMGILVGIWPRFDKKAVQDRHWVNDGSGILMAESLCWEYGIPTFRFSEYFQQDRRANDPSRSPMSLYTIGDSMHPDARGYRVAAGALAEEIKRFLAGEVDVTQEMTRSRSDKALRVCTSRFNRLASLRRHYKESCAFPGRWGQAS